MADCVSDADRGTVTWRGSAAGEESITAKEKRCDVRCLLNVLQIHVRESAAGQVNIRLPESAGILGYWPPRGFGDR